MTCEPRVANVDQLVQYLVYAENTSAAVGEMLECASGDYLLCKGIANHQSRYYRETHLFTESHFPRLKRDKCTRLAAKCTPAYPRPWACGTSSRSAATLRNTTTASSVLSGHSPRLLSERLKVVLQFLLQSHCLNTVKHELVDFQFRWLSFESDSVEGRIATLDSIYQTIQHISNGIFMVASMPILVLNAFL